MCSAMAVSSVEESFESTGDASVFIADTGVKWGADATRIERIVAKNFVFFHYKIPFHYFLLLN